MPTLKKALAAKVASAFFCLLIHGGDLAAEVCGVPQGDSQWVTVAQVVDGDTLRLVDGRKVRLIGVNTPELGHGVPDEPVARQAIAVVRQWLPQDHRIQLVPGRESQDHYGRWLAHVYKTGGDGLGPHLVGRGVAFAVAVAPNDTLAECLFDLEKRARKQGLGVWKEPYWLPTSVGSGEIKRSGFQLVGGRVMQITTGLGGTKWLDLDSDIVLYIDGRDLAHFPGGVDNWLGRQLVARGWVVQRKWDKAIKTREIKPYLLKISSPYALTY